MLFSTEFLLTMCTTITPVACAFVFVAVKSHDFVGLSSETVTIFGNGCSTVAAGCLE